MTRLSIRQYAIDFFHEYHWVKYLPIIWLLYALCVVVVGEISASIFRTDIAFLILTFLVPLLGFIAVPCAAVSSITMKSWKPVSISIINAIILPVIFFTIQIAFPKHEVVSIMRGKPYIVAYYDGTQNGAKLTLRTNGRFDIHSNGWFGFSQYHKGKYQIQNKAIDLNYDGKPSIWGNVARISKYGIEFPIDSDRWMPFDIYPCGTD